MPRKKEPPPSALPSRRSTRANNRFSDSEPLVVPMVGLGSNQEADVRISQPPSMEIPLDMNKDARPILSDARSGMPPIQDVSIEKDACRMNKEQSTVPGSNTSSECSSVSVRDMDSTADKTLIRDPPTLPPPVATKKGKDIMEDGFIKVVKKKKKYNGPKPRVQIPSLNVSKPGPSKPPGRTRPNVDNGAVHVSNPFSTLDDTTQTKDGFPELNTTLKKFAKRYVETNTIPDSGGG
ncbi:hypothetical protein L1987_64522 [Smallanthus sonchifolius]|uniref:Uncharacterized protein n=1 Tax=Smallanthus sonchifolius TaxID=185202 RepID=A0ACB9BRT5_9ASTR|nr:hypothetical protein L1987_64522 [Smallanthus sonchifolius]